MKPSYEPGSFTVQLSNLKTSLASWDDLINKSNKLTASLSITMQCVSGFLEAFQKIADIAESDNAGLRPFGIAMRRFCLRQKCVESRLRSFNSQLTDCLVTPLSDRLEEWRRTANQMDRDCVKEMRKAKSELQRAVLEAEKCKKRLRRKQERGGLTAAFDKDDYDAPNVQINFAQHDLACKQRALDQLEQRCLHAISLEERRRFAELSTCLNPVLDAHLGVLAEMGPLEEALKEIQAAHSALVVTPDQAPSSFASDTGTFRLRSTPLVKASSNNNGGSLPLDPTIATGSAALPFAVAAAPSQLSITSNSTNGGGGGGGLFGNAASISTLHSPDAESCPRLPPPPPASAGLGSAGSPGPDSLLNGGGDALSLFDHNQSLSGAPTTNSNGDNHSIASSSSLGLLPVSCDIGSGLGSVVGSLSSCGIGEGAADLPSHPPPPPPPPRSASGDDEDEEEDGGTTEGCLTDDDENDATIDAEHQFQQPNGSTAMEKSTLYPNQSLPPPVYTNISKLQAAAQRAVGVKDPQDAPRSQCSSSSTQPHDTTTSSAGDSTFANGRKFSQPTATISKGGMHSLLRSLSISGRPVVMPPPTSHAVDESLGAGEGLGLSPPSTTSMTPVIADQAPSAPGSPSSAYAQARSRLDAIFSNVESSGLRRAQTTRAESPSHPPSAIDIAGGGGVGGGCGASEVDGDVGNASTFHRRRPHQQQQRTAGINLMRGSMFQLNTTSAPPDSDFANSVDSRYGYASKQQPMTPGPGRRAPLRTQLSTANEPVQTIRPPRRSSSVCRELPSLAQQSRPQPQQQQQQTHYGSASHYAAPRGAQQHPQRVYADPRAFQQQQQQHHQQQPQPQNGVPTTPAAAAQLAAEAAARRHQQQQQYAAASGLRPAVGNRTMSPTQNGVVVGQSRLPQRQAGVASGNAHGPMAARSKNQKPAPHQFYGQQHQQQTGIPAASSASSSPSTSSCAYYGAPQQYHHHQLQQQQQQQHHYPPPPAAFDDVESTSFIEAPPPPPPQ